MVKGRVSGVEVTFLVDTGANVTIVKPSVLNRITAPERPPLERVETSMLLADGSSLPFLGRGRFRICLGEEEVFHDVWVAEIELDGIIGMDFIKKHNCRLTLGQGRYELALNGNVTECVGGDQLPRCARVAAQVTTVIPPRSESLVPAKVIDPCGEASLGITEGQVRFTRKSQLLVAKTLVDLTNGVVPLRLFNPTDQPQTVYRDTIAAWCEPVEGISEASQPGGRTEDAPAGRACRVTPSTTVLPSHLDDLYRRTASCLEETQKNEVAALLTEFADVFAHSADDLGRTGIVKHEIRTNESKPIRQNPRRLPISQRAVAEAEIESMLKRGVIEPSSSPWASPIVLVRKKDGTTRFCVDYRRLNSATVKDSYPLPRIDDSIDALSGSCWFSTLDLASGYWQVEVAEKDRPKTAFTTGSGLYQFTVMPFGLCNAPATFERLMERVLSGLPWEVCLLYLDDIIVHAATFEAELERLRSVFTRLREAGLKLSPKKCHLFKKRVVFLGHVVSEEGVSTDPEKIKAVREWPTPTSASALRSFLGLCSYYRRFVHGFANVAAPLHRLTEHDRAFVWTSECDVAFHQLKQVLAQAPVLAYPTSEGAFILDTDASNTGIGAVLSQKQGEEEKVIAYFSRSLTKSERQYCVTRKELLALVTAVRHFHHYVYGRHFKVRTDHGALRWLMNFKNPEGQTARWIEILGIYDLEVEHRQGRNHGNADGLSRRPCDNCRYCERSEKKEERFHQSDPVEDEGERNKADDEEYRCATAMKTAEHLVSKGQDGSTGASSWLATLSNTEIREAQLRDPCLGTVIRLKEQSAERPPWETISSESPTFKCYWGQWSMLAVRDGVLFRKWESERGDDISWKLVLPDSLRTDVLKQLHDSPAAGHLGFKKTTERVKARFYWCGLRKDVESWCVRCDVCASRKKPSKTPRAPMKTYNVGAPMERIAIDVMGPLPTTDRDNKYILVISDYFTKWTESYPMPNQEAVTVANVVVREFISRFGVPRQLHTDQGRNFESNLFQEMCRILEIDKTRTTPLRPQSDGMVERFNRTLEAMLSKFVDENQTDWDLYLPLLMMAYRSSVHESTGFSPNEMMLGREALLPLDLVIGQAERTGNSTTEYATKLSEQMERIHQFARQHLKLSSDRQKRNYDHRPVNHRRYDKGDAVWLYSPQKKKGICPKLMRQFDGPYLVVKRMSDVLYRIQKGSKSKPKVVHHDRLKPYRGPNVPDWLSESSAPKQTESHRASENPVKTSSPGPTSPQSVAVEPRNPPSAEPAPVPAVRRPRRVVRPPARMQDYQLD